MKLILSIFTAFAILSLLPAPALAEDVYITTEIGGELMRGSVNVDDIIDDASGNMVLFRLETVMVSDFSIGMRASQGQIRNTGGEDDDLNLLEIYGLYGVAPEVKLSAGYRSMAISEANFQGLALGANYEHDFDPQLDLVLRANYTPFGSGETSEDDNNASGLEVDAGLRYMLFEGLDLNAGYRTIRYTLEGDDGDIDASFSGIFVGISHAF